MNSSVASNFKHFDAVRLIHLAYDLFLIMFHSNEENVVGSLNKTVYEILVMYLEIGIKKTIVMPLY